MTANTFGYVQRDLGLGGSLLALMALVGSGVSVSSDTGDDIDSAYYDYSHESGNSLENFKFKDVFFAQEHTSSEGVSLSDYSDYSDAATLVQQDAAGLINRVLDEYGFSKKLLAETLGVTRPTLYSWLKGGTVSEENYDRLNAVADVIEKIDERHRVHFPSLLKMFVPNLEGMKFSDLLVESINKKDAHRFTASYEGVRNRLDRKFRIESHVSVEKSAELAINQASSMV